MEKYKLHHNRVAIEKLWEQVAKYLDITLESQNLVTVSTHGVDGGIHRTSLSACLSEGPTHFCYSFSIKTTLNVRFHPSKPFQRSFDNDISYDHTTLAV